MLFNIHTVILLALAFMAAANPASPVGEVNARPEMRLKRRKGGNKSENDDLTGLEKLAVRLAVAQAAVDVATNVHGKANLVKTTAEAIRDIARAELNAAIDLTEIDHDDFITPGDAAEIQYLRLEERRDVLADLVHPSTDGKSGDN
jgi:hypothetical protein